jgi:hypothetical protein
MTKASTKMIDGQGVAGGAPVVGIKAETDGVAVGVGWAR